MIYFILGAINYLICASLPVFLNRGVINNFTYYFLGCLTSSFGIILWLTLARSLRTSQLSLYGLIWDLILTFCYVLVPIILVKQELNKWNYLGICIIIIGIGLLKK